MTQEEFIEEINVQKERGSQLLKQVSSLHVMRNNYGDGMAVFGPVKLYYSPREELEPIEAEYDSWKSYVHDFLVSVLGEGDDMVSEWNVCLQKPYRHNISDKEWYQKEIKEALSKLNSFCQRIGFRFKKQAVSIIEKSEMIDGPKVFISHAGDDKEIIGAFLDSILKNGIGLTNQDIACTSFEWTTASIGDNIPDYIRQNIKGAKVVLAMVSKAFKKSEVCQNEVGAAWALNNRPLTIILPDVDFKEMGWLFNLDKAIKIDNEDSLNKLQEDLCKRLGVQPKTALHWKPCVTTFLEALDTLKQKSSSAVPTTEEQHQMSNQLSAEMAHDIKLFQNFDEKFAEEHFEYSLYRIQTTTHYSDYDLTIWLEVANWLKKKSNIFLNSDLQAAVAHLLESLGALMNFTSQYYSPDRISWCTDDDHNVTPEKWREIHEAKIFSWEPDSQYSELYQKQEKIVLEGLPSKVEDVENAYKDFRLAVKSILYV